MPESPQATGAVFLSYASQDSESVRRICDALRAAGIEVWFDQGELVGGDAWDTKIRNHINGCALFLPVISATTQARREGYFRLEWKLAEDRSHLIAKGTPFLLPVMIDATPEHDALVPDAFKAVQWSHLPGGETPAAFVAGVRKLLGGSSVAFSAVPFVAAPATPVPPPARPNRRVWLVAAAAAALLATAGYFAIRPATPTTVAAPTPAVVPVSAPAAPVVDDKSIAVLPFANMSTDKDTTAFFADGMQEDILTSLAHIRVLHVVSRTSVMEYRNTTKKIPQIARELNVAYVLEGSVRREGNKVRVTGQLIRAGNDEHIWAKSYDRDITDIFAIQGELGAAIAAELETALSPQEKAALARVPTKNPAAYDLYLQAKAAYAKINPDDVEKRSASWSFVASLLQTAVELDPTFAEAWCELEYVYTGMASSINGISPAYRVNAKAALDRALALAPDSPVVIQSAAHYYLFGSQEDARALALLEELVRLQPNTAEFRASLGLAQDMEGKNAEALISKRTAALLEPGRFAYSRDLQQHCQFGHRWHEALAETQRMNALKPGSYWSAQEAWLRFVATGSLKEMEDHLAGLSESQRRDPAGIAERWQLALCKGDDAEILRLDQSYPNNAQTWHHETGAMVAATVLRNHGDLAGAQARLADFQATTRARLKLQPENTAFLATAAMIEAILNHKEEALALINHAKELDPSEVHWGAELSWTRTRVYALVGEKDRAIIEIARLLRIPSWYCVHEMKGNSAYFSLRDDPRFAALPNAPLNNAPLF
jgi:TolB-like protein